MVADSSDNNPKSKGGAEKKKERTAGQFFHIGEQGEQGDASAKVGAELHPLDYWVLDPGAAWTMTPRKELLDDVRAAPINEACGNALLEAARERWRREGSKKPLELVHMDLMGPLPVQGHKGERYFLTIVDDWSRLMWAYPLKQKEDWLPFVEKKAECLLTTAYTPQSNGVAERANRTILKTARALLIESGVGNSMWPHAVRHATVARNRVLTKVGNESWVPLERWLGRKPPVDMLRVFGFMAVAHVPKKYRSKLGASAIWCVHLGLAAKSKGWLLWEPSKGVLFDSRDVKFVEGMMYGGWKKQPETKESEQMEQITMQLDLTPSVWEEGEEAAAEAGDGEKVQEAPAGGGDDVETSGSTKEAAGSEEGEQQQGKAK
ncbi:unnamed protein product, partial [Closterium sp. NIES-54]